MLQVKTGTRLHFQVKPRLERGFSFGKSSNTSTEGPAPQLVTVLACRARPKPEPISPKMVCAAVTGLSVT